MILTNKSFNPPPADTNLIHYLSIYQLLYILTYEKIVFTPVSSYDDQSEASLSLKSFINVINHPLLEKNTPVKKDEYYCQKRKKLKDLPKVEYSKTILKDRESLTKFEKSIEDIKYDTFAWLIYSFARHYMYSHCWSETDLESNLMWERYGQLGSTVAIKTTVGGLKNAFKDTELPMYIGKVKYINYATQHIKDYRDYDKKDFSDPSIIENLFYQPMFHKQKLYQDEKEIRIIISFDHLVKNLFEKSYLSNIPYYDKDLYSNIYPEKYPGTDDYGLYTSVQQKHNYSAESIHKQSVNINELIENIIISPYAKPFVYDVLQVIVNRFGLDYKKVIESSMVIK